VHVVACEQVLMRCGRGKVDEQSSERSKRVGGLAFSPVRFVRRRLCLCHQRWDRLVSFADSCFVGRLLLRWPTLASLADSCFVRRLVLRWPTRASLADSRFVGRQLCLCHQRWQPARRLLVWFLTLVGLFLRKLFSLGSTTLSIW